MNQSTNPFISEPSVYDKAEEPGSTYNDHSLTKY